MFIKMRDVWTWMMPNAAHTHRPLNHLTQVEHNDATFTENCTGAARGECVRVKYFGHWP